VREKFLDASSECYLLHRRGKLKSERATMTTRFEHKLFRVSVGAVKVNSLCNLGGWLSKINRFRKKDWNDVCTSIPDRKKKNQASQS
jgi:hypothetical protein